MTDPANPVNYDRMTVPLVIFSDLDGTLLDHETYGFEAAKPAFEILKARGIPLVLASSKTAVEIATLREKMGFTHCPAIIENGSGLLPAGPFDTKSIDQTVYKKLRNTVQALPPHLRRLYQGFGDWTVAEITAKTGLPTHEAQQASKRQFSEPGLWSGTEKELASFIQHLTNHNISARHGGRFLTLSYGGTKGVKMGQILDRYTTDTTRPPSLALGDAPNDIEMLEAADIGVIIKNPHGTKIAPLQGEQTGTIRRSDKPGPEGWAYSVLSILHEMNLYSYKA
ncbi:HAD-IIB family hydrolase [Kordiimonas pumila]|uniref:HAD-IIB family hydrolase n=1 Tax=Kordiimonas pumila TaxID=2161677 RepID=A0ABV7D7A2_9PROT|nr:HAD-IIB family hydrolase [Kordiimonas pumila]